MYTINYIQTTNANVTTVTVKVPFNMGYSMQAATVWAAKFAARNKVGLYSVERSKLKGFKPVRHLQQPTDYAILGVC